MHTQVKVVNDHDGHFDQLPNGFEGFINERRLRDILIDWRDSGFYHPVTFDTHDVPTVPDKSWWDSGIGTKILDHIFFFEDEMTIDWAHDISTVFQGHSALYIGLEQKYYHQKELAVVLRAAKFSPEELAAWMNLFWCSRVKSAFELRSPATFPQADWVKGFWIPHKAPA